MEWSFVAVGPVKADVDVPAGHVQLDPVATETIRVNLEPWGSNERRALELIEESTVDLDGDQLKVHVPQRPFRNVELRCTITLPEGSSVSAKAASADIDCSGPVARFTAAVASGDINLGPVSDELSVTTASGDVSCPEVGGRLKVKGASADVTVGRVGGAVDIALASGDVELGDVATSVKVATASGDLEIGCAHEGRISAKSASGDIRIKVAAGVGAYLDVMSMTGDMECSLPVQERNAGEAQLHLSCQTMSGDVRIESAAAPAGRVGHD